ncbi:hypothetical protein ACIHAA_00270 [Streptomyces sp. NPDC052040]|uniref:hypothetical protein n=1 Tax=Streptomyces sp. NPDC052040 TaxID=3365682 RepID=UPI0037D32137
MQWLTRTACAATAAAASLAVFAAGASAAAPPLGPAHVVRHLDPAAGQQPENLTVEADGSTVLTMAFSHQVDRLTPDGALHVLGTLPAPPDGTRAPLTGRAFAGGIVRAPDGTLYVLYSAGTDALTGLWRLRPGSAPSRIAALPGGSVPNGLVLYGDSFYATDSARGAVWRIPRGGGAAAVWKAGPELEARTADGFGANGLKVRHHALWVTNMDRGTLVRIPIGRHGEAGAVHTVADGLGSVDDFAFTGEGDSVLAADNQGADVELVRADGSHTVVLTAADGLRNPTSVARRGNTVYVTDAAYVSGTDPKLLSARLLHRR